jgi:hypothetical protein
MNVGQQLVRSQDISSKVALVLNKRTKFAQERFQREMKAALETSGAGELLSNPAAAANLWTEWWGYAIDSTQRSVLYLDTLRERGNRYIEHVNKGLPPVLHFDYETVVDGRKLAERRQAIRPGAVYQTPRLQPSCGGALGRRSAQGTRAPMPLYHPPGDRQRTAQA